MRDTASSYGTSPTIRFYCRPGALPIRTSQALATRRYAHDAIAVPTFCQLLQSLSWRLATLHNGVLPKIEEPYHPALILLATQRLWRPPYPLCHQLPCPQNVNFRQEQRLDTMYQGRDQAPSFSRSMPLCVCRRAILSADPYRKYRRRHDAKLRRC